MFNMMDISGSSLTAHKTFLNTISNNLANINTPKKADGTGYDRQSVVFEEFSDMLNNKSGVKAKTITQDKREDRLVFEPTHPNANEEGYVRFADINISEEMSNMLIAQRGYSLNLNALKYIKEMYQNTLEIGK